MLEIPQKGEILSRASMEKKDRKSVQSMDGLHWREERHGGGRDNLIFNARIQEIRRQHEC